MHVPVPALRPSRLRVLAVGALSTFAAGALAATITGVSPQGEVAQVRQVVVRFSEPVVRIGDPRLADPVTIDCKGAVPRGTGRWLDERSWAYDYAEPLGPGVRCSVAVRADGRMAPGTGVGTAPSGPTGYAFSTGGPAIVSARPPEGGSIAEDQLFLLRLHVPAVEASVLANAWCEVEGLGERIGVRLVAGEARAALLKARRLDGKATLDRKLVLGCRRPLPNGTPMRLVWGRGIAAASNPQAVTSGERRLAYEVRPTFGADFSCERERANAPCVPVRPMTLRFSAPVAREVAAAVRLAPASGPALAPAFDADDKAVDVTELRWPGPFAESATYTLRLPAALADDAGRPLANAAMFPLAVETGAAPPIARFAAAPFGVVEAADPVVPVTLRHVQGDLRPGADGGQVRVRTLASDADILAWYAKVKRYDESRLSARALGRPEADWFVWQDDADGAVDKRGRPVRRKVERMIEARTLPLLEGDPAARRLDLPQLGGGDPRPFEVVGVPLGGPGYHVVEIASRRLGASLLDKPAPVYVRTGVLVTNLGVHFKLGRENSVVWVTSLDRGKPVEGAEVTVADCTGKPLWSGRTDAEGLARVARALDADTPRDCPADPGLFVVARKPAGGGGGIDTAFVFSSWQKGIEPWRFNQPTGRGPAPELRAATVFDRTLLRAGETVSMKHYARLETSAGLAPLPAGERPTEVRIVHEGSGQEVVQALVWRADGRNATGSWPVPPAAKLGRYEVSLRRTDAQGRRREWATGSFRVEAFRVPLVDAKLSGPKDVQVAPASLSLAVQLNHRAGGAMARAPARVSAVLKDRTPEFAGHDDYSFQPPKEPDKAAGNSGSGDADAEGDAAAPADGARLVADKLALTTDRQGAANLVLKDLPPITRPGRIDAELTYADPNGETQTTAAQIEVWPSAVVLGVRTASWASSRGRSTLTVLALDTGGRPLKGQAIEVRGRLERTISTRKRMVGGFYAYDNRREATELGRLCSGSSDDRGLLRCEVELQSAGQVELIARASDRAGHVAEAAGSVWVTRHGELWFAQDNDDRIDVLPEKKRYEPGETARLQVRMPFREATALVAVEREGVLATRVVTLRGDDPTVELTIDPAWGPNVYVSVLALRGRLREVPWYSFFRWGWREPLAWARSFWFEGREYRAPTAMVDLSKPAFKLGVAALRVGLGAHALKVAVTSDRPQYAVRGKAAVKVRVTTAGGAPAPAGTELAFAAVDEGLLALRDNDSWQLLDAMFQPRAWGVETATAQSEIVGRRHHGRKAVAAGGGGGRGATRELFDTLLLWRPVVALDANGEATLEVPLNDSLTSFRLVAIADTADGARYGTGSTSIRVTQDLQILAGLPPLVRDGDRFGAMLTLRNTTARAMQVRATLAGAVERGAASDAFEPAARAVADTGGGADRRAGAVARAGAGTRAGPDAREGAAEAPDRVALALPPQDLTLAAGAAHEVVWPIDVPAGATTIVWEAGVVEQSGAAGGASAPPANDRLRLTQRILPAVPVRVLQATLQQLEGTVTLPIAAPADALPASGPKRGGLRVTAQPTLAGALPGLRRWFATYPYACLEQQASKAVGLNDPKLWASVLNTLPTYLDRDGLASYFPPRGDDAPRGSDRLTAYLLAVAHEAGFALPAEARDAMLGGLKAFVEGRIERAFWSPRADLDVRKLAAIEALSRYGRADARQLGSINLVPNAWPTGAVIDWLRILKRVKGVPDAARRLDEANRILRARLSYAGTTLRFANEQEDFWWWLMESADANAAKLILAVLDDPAWNDELPRMVAGALGRQRGGAWLTTPANLWGALALDRFAARFEATPVSGRTAATLGAATQALDWQRAPGGGTLAFGWPPQPGPLNIAQDGTGRPWVTVQSLAAIPLAAPLRAGYDVKRSVVAVERKTEGAWSRGDIVRVRLEVEAQSDRTWVVVSDPIPGGATILGSGLGRDSALATRGEQRAGSAWPAYEERSFEAFRGYYEFLPSGRHVIEYTLRLNNPGRFALPPTRVEAMYAPETFGESPNAGIEVAP